MNDPDGLSAGGHRTPLSVHVLFHPESEEAADLARALFDRLNGRARNLGPRIPVRFGAHTADGMLQEPHLHSARSLASVVLVDRRMARRAEEHDRRVADAWADLIEMLLRTCRPGASTSCAVLPVAVDSGAFHLTHSLRNKRSFVRLDGQTRRHLELHVAIRCLRLIAGRPASEVGDADALPSSDVEIFLSHAKRDLSGKPSEGPVAALLTAHHAFPVNPWFDSSNIPAGAEFAPEIEKAINLSHGGGRGSD